VLLARRKMSDCEPGSQNCEPGSQFRIVNQAAPHPKNGENFNPIFSLLFFRLNEQARRELHFPKTELFKLKLCSITYAA